MLDIQYNDGRYIINATICSEVDTNDIAKVQEKFISDCAFAFAETMKDAVNINHLVENKKENTDNTLKERISRFLDGIDEAIDCIYENPKNEHDQLIYNEAYRCALEKYKICLQSVIEGREFYELRDCK